MTGRGMLPVIVALGITLAGCHARDPRTPVGYPDDYGTILRAADAERHLLIWSAIDQVKARPLLDAFRRAHPMLAVRYVELPGKQLNERFLAAAAQRQPLPDLLWSSAMDLQIKLTNDGYAQTYVSPEAAHLPDWANWKNQAWGTTAEPIVLVYNKQRIASAAVPATHTALIALLERRPPSLRGAIATYDVPNSAVGYLYLLQDQEASRDIWRLVRAMADNGLQLHANAEQIMAAVESGKAAIGYNIVGSYARDEVRRHPQLGMVLPSDYTLVMSRIALIPAGAPHPAAARLFVDFLLSPRGQSFLAARSMPSARADVPGPADLRAADIPFRAIRVGPGLLVGRDQLTRRYFLKRWRTAAATRPES